jgi:hypothetical protein
MLLIIISKNQAAAGVLTGTTFMYMYPEGMDLLQLPEIQKM